ncbi:hypothetical protein PLICRDRAFT_700930 [Plicaturopsis crispa FD-325 SS-3]|nr:hypothetical protein PLICRDRAFT_700930 [Plicaturopsis crispa FD-325 SS-3]
MAHAVAEFSKLEFKIPRSGKIYSLLNPRHATRTRAMAATPCTTATILHTIHESTHSIVYRASIDGQQVILKRSVYHPRRHSSYIDLEAEADVYQANLVRLQGTVIPHYYGFYQSSDDSEEKVCCLVLEDCGDPVPSFYGLPADVKLKIMQLVKTLHDEGYGLCDFAERNVVCRDDRYRLIDFDDIATHSCNWDGNLHVGERRPTNLVCRYTLVCGLDMNFWPVVRPPSVLIGSTPCPKKWYPSQQILDALLLGINKEDIDLNFEYVQKIVLEYHADVVAGKQVDFDATRQRIHQLPRRMSKKRPPFNGIDSSYTPVY